MSTEKMAERILPEPADVASGTILIAVAGFAALVALTMTVLFFYLKSAAPAAFEAAVVHDFPEPALQTSPQNDLKAFERKQRDDISSYGWVDRTKELIHIPIEKAMRIIVGKGEHAYDAPDQSAGTPGSGGADGISP